MSIGKKKLKKVLYVPSRSFFRFFRVHSLIFTKFYTAMNYSSVNRAVVRATTYIVFLLFLPIWLIDIAVRPNRMIVKRIEISVTSICTLKCRNCSDLMQYYRREKKTYTIDTDTLTSDIKIIFSAVDYIAAVSIIGGEPFIYPHLPKILSILTSSDKVGKVLVTTNGTVMPNDEILSVLKNKKVTVKMSKYPIEVTSAPDKTYKTLKSNNVAVYMETPKWRDPYGERGLAPRGREKAVLALNFRNCRKCTELVDGKIHYCPVSAHGMFLGLITPNNNDYVDIRAESIDRIREKLKEFDKPPKGFYVRACDHCDTGMPDVPQIPPAIQEL